MIVYVYRQPHYPGEVTLTTLLPSTRILEGKATFNRGHLGRMNLRKFMKEQGGTVSIGTYRMFEMLELHEPPAETE